MNKELDKKLMFENISYLLQETGIKIGELEAEAGVSPGYISRSTKDEKSKPGIDFIIGAAHALNISVDTLISVRFSELTPTEKYLVEFLEKLKRDTADDKLTWNKELADKLNRMEADINGNTEHPLFSMETFFEMKESGYPEEVTRVIIVSDTFGCNTAIAGDCFNLEMKNGARLYIMNLSKSAYNIRESDVMAKEIWVHMPQSIPKFMCSTAKNSPLADLVEDLYFVVAEFSKCPKIAEDILHVIDAFMQDDYLSDDPDHAFKRFDL